MNGDCGTSYSKDDITIYIAEYCYRHSSSTKFIRLYKDDEVLIEVRNTTKNAEKVLEMLKELIK